MRLGLRNEDARVQGSCVEPVVAGLGLACTRNSSRDGHPDDAADYAGRQKSQSGPENRSKSHAVRLATKPDGAVPRASGHIYRYFQEGLRGRFSGEAVLLVTGPPATIPVQLKPVIGEIAP